MLLYACTIVSLPSLSIKNYLFEALHISSTEEKIFYWTAHDIHTKIRFNMDLLNPTHDNPRELYMDVVGE